MIEDLNFLTDNGDPIGQGKVAPDGEESYFNKCSVYLDFVQNLKTDYERLQFIDSFRQSSRQNLEDVCPALITLSSQKFCYSFKSSFESFLLDLLDVSDSRLVRKTSLHILRSKLYTISGANPFFALFSALEETQYHVVEPILPKLRNVIALVQENKLSWRYLEIILKKMISHTNGWIRCFGFRSVVDIPTELFREEIKFLVYYYRNLNSYDPFWRLDETIGLVTYIQKLKKLNQECLSGLFVKELFTLFETRFSPASLVFLSQTLPEGKEKCICDIKLLRRLVTEISSLQYPNFKDEVVSNFMKFIVESYDWSGDQKGIISLLSLLAPTLRLKVCRLMAMYIAKEDIFNLFDERVFYNGLIDLLFCLPRQDFNAVISSCEDIDIQLGVAARRVDYLDQNVRAELLVRRLFESNQKITNEEDYIDLCIGPIFSQLEHKPLLEMKIITSLPTNNSNLSRCGVLRLLSYRNLNIVPQLSNPTPHEKLAFFHFLAVHRVLDFDLNDEVEQSIEVFAKDTEKGIAFLEDCCSILTDLKLETRMLLLERCEILAKETQKSANFPVVCKCWIHIAINGMVENRENAMCSLEKIMDIGSKNSQIAYLFSKSLMNTSLCVSLSNLVMNLAIYGGIMKKDDQVFYLANALLYKKTANLLYHYEKLPIMVRENAILAIFNRENSDDFFTALTMEVINEIAEVDKSRSKSFGLSLGHRLKTRLVLLLLLLVKHNPSNPYKQQIINLCVETILDGSQQFSIRLPVEWILTIYCLDDEEFFDEWLKKDLEFGEKRIGAVVPWMFVILRCLKERPQKLFIVIIQILRWVTVSNFGVKCASVAALKLLYRWYAKEIMLDTRLEFIKELVTFNPEINGNSQTVVDNLVNDPYFNQISAAHVDLNTVFYCLPYLCGMPSDELIFSVIPESEVLNGLTSFLSVFRYGPVKVSDVFSTLVKNKTSASEVLGMIPHLNCVDDSDDFQQKIDPNTIIFERNGKELVVVASLINKTANLGGLCRTCEVFGASSLVLSNENITHDLSFKALSMSAEKWLPIIEVKPDGLLGFLEASKLQGYRVIAAEQTAASVPLHKFKFPNKTLILLGEEKKGVPPELIKVVDQTVEIEQFGKTRSLNVHVSASLFIYQFASQNYC